jgi:hypothetical protein
MGRRHEVGHGRRDYKVRRLVGSSRAQEPEGFSAAVRRARKARFTSNYNFHACRIRSRAEGMLRGPGQSTHQGCPLGERSVAWEEAALEALREFLGALDGALGSLHALEEGGAAFAGASAALCAALAPGDGKGLTVPTLGVYRILAATMPTARAIARLSTRSSAGAAAAGALRRGCGAGGRRRRTARPWRRRSPPPRGSPACSGCSPSRTTARPHCSARRAWRSSPMPTAELPAASVCSVRRLASAPRRASAARLHRTARCWPPPWASCGSSS